MWKPFAAAVALALLATPAFAGQCPKDMKKVDAALDMTKITGDNLAKAISLRYKGEKLHKEGEHKESIAALAGAMKALGM
jgi:hypothetical protein